jgi:hypothetical protein
MSELLGQRWPLLWVLDARPELLGNLRSEICQTGEVFEERRFWLEGWPEWVLLDFREEKGDDSDCSLAWADNMNSLPV